MERSKIYWKDESHYKQFYELSVSKIIIQNTLSLKNFPIKGISELPKINPKFKGSNTDFIKKHKQDKELGDAGESLVMNLEKEKLISMQMVDYAEKVRIAQDGKGFDILSFNEKGVEIYIEVKTTNGNEQTPFHISHNEKLFCDLNQRESFIYRLYNYDDVNNVADYFVISDIKEELLLQPSEYKAYLKAK